MITYKEACKIANEVRQEHCSNCIYACAVEISDRWAFSFSIYAPDDERGMTPAPAFFVYKNDGHVEWYSIPPLENLELILAGKEIAFLEDA